MDTLNRILSFDWRGGDNRRQASQLALFNEYLRRTALWCQVLDLADAHPIVTDLPNQLVTGIKATPVNTTLMQQTLRTVGKTNVYERMLLTRVLDWAAIADTDAVCRYGLPDPYEPLLLFYERGGWLAKTEQRGVWEISGAVDHIERAIAYLDLQPLPLDPVLLDELDAEMTA